MPWKRLCRLDELQDQQGVEFALDGVVLAAFLREGNVLVVDGMCAHQGGPIAQGTLDGTCVTCPWHGWQYDITSGCNLLTGKKMLDTFNTEIREDDVWVEIP